MGGDGNGNGDGNRKQPPPKNGSGRIAPPPPYPPQQCPRCFSTTTKFCYYNNNCASQPRYHCKSCRRYWTLGGALRNIPIGGNSRKGTKQMTKDGLASGSLSSCSSYIGECSRVQENHSPLRPPLLPPPAPTEPSLPHMRGLSYMDLSFPNSLTSPGGIFPSFATMQNLNRSQGFNQVPPNSGGHTGGAGGIHGAHSTNFSLLQGSSSSPNMPRLPQIQQPIYQFQNGRQAMAQPNRPVGSLIQVHNNPSNSNINATWARRNNIPGFGSGPAMNNQNQWSDEFDLDDVDDLFSGSSPPPPPF